eukprot:971407-Alexandrium_andersonii.AAC.1
MSSWINGWTPACAFAGVAGRGAQDAWYGLAARCEQALLGGRSVTSTSVDVYKAFDQVCRPLVYCAMLKAGWPTQLVQAYAKFQE